MRSLLRAALALVLITVVCSQLTGQAVVAGAADRSAQWAGSSFAAPAIEAFTKALAPAPIR